MTTPAQDMDIRAGLSGPVRRNCWTCRLNQFVNDLAICNHSATGDRVASDKVNEWWSATNGDTQWMPPKDSDGCPGYQPIEDGAHLHQHAVLDRLDGGEGKYGATLRVGWADGPTALYQEDLDGIDYGVVIGIPPAEMTARVALAVRSELRVRGIDPDGPGGHPCPLAQPVAIDPSPSARSPDGGYWPPDL